jgi:hypothetical protein
MHAATGTPCQILTKDGTTFWEWQVLKNTSVTSSIIFSLYVEIFWVMTPCCDVVGYHCFGGPCCLHLQGEVNDAGKGTDIGRGIPLHSFPTISITILPNFLPAHMDSIPSYTPFPATFTSSWRWMQHGSLETLSYITACCHNPDDYDMTLHCCENLKSCIICSHLAVYIMLFSFLILQ